MSGFINSVYDFISIAIFVIFFGAIYLIYKKVRGQTTFLRWKHLLFSFGGVIILSISTSVIALATGNLPAESNTNSTESSTKVTTQSATTEEKVSSSSKKSSSKEGTDPADLSNSKLKEYNATLTSALTEDQKEAQNGKDAYNWSLYIDSIYYDKNRGFIVEVLPEFQQLSNSDKATIGNSIGNFSKAQLLMIGEDVEAGDPSPYLSFHYGEKRIGHSRAWNPDEFKWSN